MFNSLLLVFSIIILYFIIENNFNTIFSTSNIDYTIPEREKIKSLENDSTISNLKQVNARDENQDCKDVQITRIDNSHIVSEKLKTYNQQLTRALRTLEYISIMEINSKTHRTSFQTKELADLKVDSQRQVIILSNKIKAYKLSQNKTLAA